MAVSCARIPVQPHRSTQYGQSRRYHCVVPISSVTNDTEAWVGAVMVERWAAMTATEKLRLVFALNDNVEAMAAAGIRDRFPEATEHEIRMRLGVLRYGPELMATAYGWHAAAEGL
jgi:aspartate aminotransferase-like enzyme